MIAPRMLALRCMGPLALLWAGVAFGEPGAAESALTEAEFNAILNDFSYLEHSPNLTNIKEDQFHLDGFVDEPFWAEAVTFTKFHVVSPATLVAPRHATEAKIAYSDQGLYVGFISEQPPESLIERPTGRDRFRGVVRDVVGIALDASGTGRFGYFFNVALGGSLRDGTIRPERSLKIDWDGAWEARTQRTGVGWSAEFMIPWSVISLPKTGTKRQLAVRLWREIGYTGEELAWPALPDQSPKFISAFQPISVEGVSPSNKYQFVPYVSSSYREAQSSYQARAGFDVSWRPSSNFQVTSALYPDFGNVEADDQDINLTAFEQFFPEKRIFFQEGVDVFITSPRSSPYWMRGYNPEPIYMLHTRRIGGRPRLPELAENQEIQDRAQFLPNELYAAAKITGQAGQVEYGLLMASEQDELFNVVETIESGEQARIDIRGAGQDFGVARLKYERRADDGTYFGLGSFSGSVRHPREDAFVQGVDWHYQSSGGRWQVDGQAIYSDTDSHGQGEAAHMEVARKPGFGVTQVVAVSYMSDGFDLNDIGYHRRNDSMSFEGRYIRETAERPGFRWFETALSTYQQWNTSGDLVRSGFFYSNEMQFESLREFELDLRFFPAAYEDWNTRGNGTYKKEPRGEILLAYSADRSKPLHGGAQVEVGNEELGGMRYIGRARLNWRPGETTEFSVRFSLDRTLGQVLHHDEREMGEFDRKGFDSRLEFSYYPNDRHQLSALIRWNLIRAKEMNRFLVPEPAGKLIKIHRQAEGAPWDFTATLMTMQLRYRWKIAPLTDLFVVYSRVSDDRLEGLLDMDDVAEQTWDAPLYADFIVKFRYRLGSH